jgi:hypothetical protein
MSKQLPELCITDHPAIIAIAMDIVLTPSHRSHYSDLVLTLADAALERIGAALAKHEGSENSYRAADVSPP